MDMHYDETGMEMTRTATGGDEQATVWKDVSRPRHDHDQWHDMRGATGSGSFEAERYTAVEDVE